MSGASALRSVLLTPSPRLSRASFILGIEEILGDVRFLWTPQVGDAATSTDDSPTRRVITWDASVAARISAQGHGYVQTNTSAGTQGGSVPDTNDLSFNTAGLTDLAFSIVALANVTDTAAARTIFAKYDNAGTLREYLFNVGATDLLQLILYDESLDKLPFRQSNAAITMGSPHLFGATYNGVGSTTAADGIVLYQDAAVIASTATNDALYVAMENTNTTPSVGRIDAATGQFMDGAFSLVAVCAGVLTLAQMVALKNQCNQYFSLAL